MEEKPILQVMNLTTKFTTYQGTEKRTVNAVDDVSFDVSAGDTVALIGESGCGKSTLAQSLLRVLPPAGHILKGKILFEGENLLDKSPQEMTRIRGEKISMILQDPMMSLDPLFTVGDQIGEGLRFHRGLHGQALGRRIEDLLIAVRIPDPTRRMKQWPHQMSGGMKQRIVGAIALACEPRLIIADEPTTGLDVTIQLQYLDLLKDIQDRTGVALVFITHDLGVVAQMCRYVLVMYAGRIVERARVTELFDEPRHPYTKALLGAAFGLHDLSRKVPISGEPPDPGNYPPGCRFHPRCMAVMDVCRNEEPAEIRLEEGRSVKCWQYASA